MKSTSFRRSLVAASTMLIMAGSAAMLAAGIAHADTAKQETAGEMLDDTVVTTKVKTAFFQDAQVSALRINVTSNKGVVQLSGFANSVQEADRAAEIARNVPGVREVKNDILLK